MSDLESQQIEEKIELLRMQAMARKNPGARVAAKFHEKALLIAPELSNSDDVTQLAQEASPAAVRALNRILGDPYAPYNAVIAAAGALLDRGHGKPHQATSVQTDMTITVVSGIPLPPNSGTKPVTIDHAPQPAGELM